MIQNTFVIHKLSISEDDSYRVWSEEQQGYLTPPMSYHGVIEWFVAGVIRTERERVIRCLETGDFEKLEGKWREIIPMTNQELIEAIGQFDEKMSQHKIKPEHVQLRNALKELLHRRKGDWQAISEK